MGLPGLLAGTGYAGFAKLYVPAELAPLTEVGCPPRPAGRVPARDRIDGLLAIRLQGLLALFPSGIG